MAALMRTYSDRHPVVAVIPAYNEARSIGSVVLQSRKYADTVIVVDDGSTDDTFEIAEAAGAVAIRHPVNHGKGVALSTAIRKAREYDPAAVVMIDGDGQHLPEEMGVVLAPVLEGKADIVVGSRYLEQRSDVPRHRVIGHWGFNLLTNLASGVSATDSQSGFRAFSARAISLVSFQSKGFSVESEMQFLARDLNLRFLEVPITIRYLDKPKRSVISQGLMVLNGVLRLMGQHRPLLFFSVPGFGMLAAGMAEGLWVVDRYNLTHQLATGTAMLSVLFCMFGLMFLSTGFVLHSIRGLLIDMLRQVNDCQQESAVEPE